MFGLSLSSDNSIASGVRCALTGTRAPLRLEQSHFFRGVPWIRLWSENDTGHGAESLHTQK